MVPFSIFVGGLSVPKYNLYPVGFPKLPPSCACHIKESLQATFCSLVVGFNNNAQLGGNSGAQILR